MVFSGAHTQPIYLLAEERVKTLPFLVCRSLTGGVAKSQCLLIQRFGPSSHLGSAPSSPTHTEQGPCLASASTDPVQQWVLLLNQHHRNYRFLNVHPPVGDSMQPLHLREGAIPSVARVALLGWLSWGWHHHHSKVLPHEKPNVPVDNCLLPMTRSRWITWPRFECSSRSPRDPGQPLHTLRPPAPGMAQPNRACARFPHSSTIRRCCSGGIHLPQAAFYWPSGYVAKHGTTRGPGHAPYAAAGVVEAAQGRKGSNDVCA